MCAKRDALVENEFDPSVAIGAALGFSLCFGLVWATYFSFAVPLTTPSRPPITIVVVIARTSSAGSWRP
jgi:hypothetical protein